MLRMRMNWPTLDKKRCLIYFYILLFFGCLILIRRYDHTAPTIAIPTNRKFTDLSSINTNSPNTTKHPLKPSKTAEYPLICSTQTCPTTINHPTKIEGFDIEEAEKNIISSLKSCPDYFRWIHEDLTHWKVKGITEEMVEAGKKEANFRVIILDGRVYVEEYKKVYQTRDMFTIWGILQMLRLYPGKLPDLDIMFNSDDKPVIKKSDYYVNDNDNDDDDVNVKVVPPMFHYCGDDEHLDIPFPDWSFWGWHEMNIKPWEVQLEDIKQGNNKLKWVDRVPNAYWKGNAILGKRKDLLRCNSTRAYKSEIYDEQSLSLESKDELVQSNLADQCNYRYKIYMEGKAWSTSEKYIQACDSMLLLVQPQYYEFFSRSLLPLKHYWPINPSRLCESIKFAVNWGNKNQFKAREIGQAGSRFITEELKMRYIYDYMYHLLNEYGKLMKYKPNVPPKAVEICTESMACNAFGKEKKWKFDSLVKTPSQTSPCTIPPAYDPQHLQKFFRTKEEVLRDVEGLARVGSS